ncbi:MAG TPA: tRNA pseudouridine(38-40) synthase TruA [Chloroflexi bacterium]|nr:MAG: tRNA pseudouridine(38-40) synthase TruA [Chloroflexota bacterium]HDD55300.1 tRNA pseudouridine(38-40) synthase TruA [Chloroflexota bacterium]
MSDRFRVLLAYDGTDFSGSQYQPELRTVQGELEGALAKIGWQGKRVLFAGRTDAGVHAAGQVAAFDLDWSHTEEELTRALNAVLPPDIAATQILRTRNDFQPRYEALSREYHYRILISPTRDPLQERYCWRVWPELDLRLMKRESRYLIGSHDFAALGTPHQPGGSTVREIRRARWYKNGNSLIFEIVGNAFLYHMVRRIVIALVKIGKREEPGSGIEDYLETPSGPPVQGLAPARGLSLVKVEYRD